MNWGESCLCSSLQCSCEAEQLVEKAMKIKRFKILMAHYNAGGLLFAFISGSSRLFFHILYGVKYSFKV